MHSWHQEGLSSSGAFLVGAITNGMGNPTEIPILSEFFHFCVSAEEEPGIKSDEIESYERIWNGRYWNRKDFLQCFSHIYIYIERFLPNFPSLYI